MTKRVNNARGKGGRNKNHVNRQDHLDQGFNKAIDRWEKKGILAKMLPLIQDHVQKLFNRDHARKQNQRGF